MVITALLAFLVGGSGQAFQAVACPSHDGSQPGVLDGPGLGGSETNGSEHRGDVHHGHGSSLGEHGATHGNTRLDDAGPPPEHEGHPCVCVGACCGSAAAERATPQGLACQHALSVPATLLKATSAVPAASGRSYLLPFANAPPVSI